MTEPQNVSLREFFDEKFRRLEDQNEAQTEKLDAVLDQARLTNGRVGKAEIAIAVLQVGYGVGFVVLGVVAYWLFGKLP